MRSQTLLAQKPKRVGQLANVGAKVRNKNETAKLFGNFLSFNNFFAWFEGCSQNHRGQVLSLGAMNLSPMIPDPNSHPRHYLFPLFVNIIWLY